MKVLVPLAAALVGAVAVAGIPASAQSGSADRIRQVVVFGDDPCPRGAAGEIVVCARKPDNERFRIPEELRGTGEPATESWAARAESIEYMGQTGIQSCSPVGPGGFTGCWEEMMRQAREERRNPQPRR